VAGGIGGGPVPLSVSGVGVSMPIAAARAPVAGLPAARARPSAIEGPLAMPEHAWAGAGGLSAGPAAEQLVDVTSAAGGAGAGAPAQRARGRPPRKRARSVSAGG
jgi:hypothetical protein